MKGYAALIGALAGLLVSKHWIGALVGAAVGLLVDAGFFRIGGLFGRANDSQEPITAVFVLLGRLAKADGRVDESEIALCERLMQRLGLSERARRTAVEAFQRGKQLETDLSAAFAALRQSRRHAPLFLEIFIDMALADGRVDPEERRLLGKFAWMLGVRESALEMLLARRAGSRRGSNGIDTSDPYAVLGLDRQASDDDVRRTFRKLMSRHHPDKLAASGAAPEVVKLAQERTQEILAAYEKIKAARGLRN